MSRSQRKIDHIKHALNQEPPGGGYDDIRFVHQSLPETDAADVNLKQKFQGKDWDYPVMINAMTGGGGTETERLNESLAEASAYLKIPMAVGSQTAAVKDVSQEHSYTIVRRKNPSGLIFANAGMDCTYEQALRCVDMIEADAMQIHLNTVQELVMPEGDRAFSGILAGLEKLVRDLPVPLIVKEVGFGMSRDTINKLSSIGVSRIDVGGRGGTNFASIENARRSLPLEGFNSWGMTTAESLLEVRGFGGHVTAAGGIRDAGDAVKSFALGADAVGMAGPALRMANEGGTEAVIDGMNHMIEEIRFIMTALGTETVEAVRHVPYVLHGSLKEWAEQRPSQ
ncbi:type 2 isopentenyl-diphosphate Delta-isomerase [Alkalicoccus chagannorensis]|uniref:type 2 isopentenyl-diphosphate Delta-isomerase n=1 Tax=Alkalicoccus chagannorensis TaxID=427072 RepID=UPI0003FE79C3|nr:type 2 isopentenyl-diphosphate Delta-isomerase [Alkalicoccus chagannorensis]